jgi:hypothetical protein
MSTQHTIAGLLTAFGLIGLAIAPMQAPAEELRAKANRDQVALAISLGGQLRLERDSARHTLKTTASAITHNMVCRDVYRLQLADIGLRCRTLIGTKTVALAN